MQMTNVKEEARQLVESLPEGSTWEDLMHEIYVRQAVEAGLDDSDAGRVTPLNDVRARFEILLGVIGRLWREGERGRMGM